MTEVNYLDYAKQAEETAGNAISVQVRDSAQTRAIMYALISIADSLEKIELSIAGIFEQMPRAEE